MIQPPVWAGGYIGIPFGEFGRDKEHCDCWGLVRLVLSEQARLMLPSLSTMSDLETRLYMQMSEEWLQVQPGQEISFDIVEMSTPVRLAHGWDFPPLHVGVIAADGWMLHTERSTASLLARYREGFIKKRVLGFWRHRTLANVAA